MTLKVCSGATVVSDESTVNVRVTGSNEIRPAGRGDPSDWTAVYVKAIVPGLGTGLKVTSVTVNCRGPEPSL